MGRGAGWKKEPEEVTSCKKAQPQVASLLALQRTPKDKIINRLYRHFLLILLRHQHAPQFFPALPPVQTKETSLPYVHQPAKMAFVRDEKPAKGLLNTQYGKDIKKNTKSKTKNYNLLSHKKCRLACNLILLDLPSHSHQGLSLPLLPSCPSVCVHPLLFFSF
jgi:hypothetical protein